MRRLDVGRSRICFRTGHARCRNWIGTNRYSHCATPSSSVGSRWGCTQTGVCLGRRVSAMERDPVCLGSRAMGSSSARRCCVDRTSLRPKGWRLGLLQGLLALGSSNRRSAPRRPSDWGAMSQQVVSRVCACFLGGGAKRLKGCLLREVLDPSRLNKIRHYLHSSVENVSWPVRVRQACSVNRTFPSCQPSSL